MTITPAQIVELAGIAGIIVALLKVMSMLRVAGSHAAKNAAAAVLRSDEGHDEIDHRIQIHSADCKYPAAAHAEILALADESHQERLAIAATAHRELTEAVGRIETSTNALSGRVENLTNVVFELARNGKNARSGA